MLHQTSLDSLAQPHFWLANARIPLACLDPRHPYRVPIPEWVAPPWEEALVAAHIEVQYGKITAIIPAHEPLPVDSPPGVDCRQGLIWPCFVDVHTHLDKAHIWPRQANPTGTFADALEQVVHDQQQHWHPEELTARMEFALKCSYAHGTKALRTHLDCGNGLSQISFSALSSLQKAWAGKLELQGVSLVPLDFYSQPEGVDLANLVAEFEGILGAVVYPQPELDHYLDAMFKLAAERHLDLDFHADESLNPEANGLLRIAEAKLRHQFSGAVTVGHCCSLAVQDEATVHTTLQRVKEAELAIVSLPMCNLYLQDRHPGTMPRHRGVTLLHELQHAQIPVALASDNCRDPFFAYGDHDMVEVFSQSVRIGQLDRPMGQWPQAVTHTPAMMMNLSDQGFLGVGQPADVIIFGARTFNELLSRPQHDRILIREGKRVNTALPDYRDLDGWVSPSVNQVHG